MIFRACLFAALAGTLVANASYAGDAAARRFIGFSPDGHYFAFEQYTTLYDSTESFAEIQIIDTRTDKLVDGSPLRVAATGDDDKDMEWVRRELEGKAESLIKTRRLGEPGSYVGGQPSMDLEDIGIYQADPKPLAKSLDVPLPGGRKARLAIGALPLGTAMCEGYGGRSRAGRAKVAGLKLTMSLDSAPPVVLQQDKALPKSRRCAAEYGIAEAYLHTDPQGVVTLAALIEYADNHEYHAGPNRRFMAVTKRLPKP